MRVLVTGGAGFLGSHLVDALLEVGHDVRVFDDYSTGSPLNLTHAYFRNVRTHRGSVEHPGDIDDAFDKFGPEVVYHLAAQIDVRTSVEDPARDARINVGGTVNVLNACRSHGVRRFVLASSAAVYGHQGARVDLTTPYLPISPYGAGKAAAEAYALAYDRMATLAGNDFGATTVILSNVYGPRQRANFGAVNLFVRRALAGETVTLYGDGRNVRDYVHVVDVVRTLMWAGGCYPANLGRRVWPSRVMCGTGFGTTDAELWKLVCRIVADETGREIPPLAVAELAPARPADIRSMVFGEPNWSTGRLPLDIGVRKLVQELRKELGL